MDRARAARTAQNGTDVVGRLGGEDRDRGDAAVAEEGTPLREGDEDLELGRVEGRQPEEVADHRVHDENHVPVLRAAMPEGARHESQCAPGQR